MARSARRAAAALLVALALAPLAAPARAAGELVTLRGTYVEVHGDRRTGGETLHYLRTGSTWQRLRFDVELRPGGYGWRFASAGGGSFSDSGSGTCH